MKGLQVLIDLPSLIQSLLQPIVDIANLEHWVVLAVARSHSAFLLLSAVSPHHRPRLVGRKILGFVS